MVENNRSNNNNQQQHPKDQGVTQTGAGPLPLRATSRSLTGPTRQPRDCWILPPERQCCELPSRVPPLRKTRAAATSPFAPARTWTSSDLSRSTFSSVFQTGQLQMIRDVGEAEARYAVVKLIDGLRDIATPAGPTPRKLTQPTGARAANAVRPRRRKRPRHRKGARAMIADFGLLLRSLGEQHLYRKHHNRSGGETLSTRAAIRSLTPPFAAQPRCKSADGHGNARALTGSRLPMRGGGAGCRRRLSPTGGRIASRSPRLPSPRRGLGSASGRRSAFRALSTTGSPQGGNPR